ncbi:olfactory receptor 5AP2-like [Gavia stellata]|uniref:olfactory receptor 5AP2-like n=1 Tax=Gavia stellata TaxID=37040 RepID=UPI0028991C01|nr:olfactory receptor 5AP2-like [Gavia stellata]
MEGRSECFRCKYLVASEVPEVAQGWTQALQETLIVCLMELLGSMDLHYGMGKRTFNDPDIDCIGNTVQEVSGGSHAMRDQKTNGSSMTKFLLLAFADTRELQLLLFVLLLIIYTATVFGNILIVVLVMADQHLHTPMYFFLGNLSCLETCYSSTILPWLLASFLTGDKTISAPGCMAQFHFFSSFAGTECYLLAAMSYDRYLAIGQPLLYASLMTWRVSLQLAAGPWLGGLLLFAALTFLLSQLPFCGPKAIDHFFCDFSPLLELSCSDTRVLTQVALTFGFSHVVFPFLFVLASYMCIIAAILRIPSRADRQKAFSTCFSHLTVVTVFYGTLITVYMLPRTAPLRQLNKAFSFFYTILTPLVNPLIYSLRNREVREALWKMLRKAKACSW